MARLPYVEPATASEEVRKLFSRLPVPLNIFKMVAHADTNLRAVVRFGTAILSEQKLSPKLRELAILRVAKLSGARYEWVQHISIAKMFGTSDAQIAQLEHDEIGAPGFDEVEQLVLRFTSEVVRYVGASEATFAQMRQRFSAQEIIELLLGIGFYMMMARIMETTKIDLEPDAGTRIVDPTQLARRKR